MKKNQSPTRIKSHADLAGYQPSLCVIKLGSAVVTTGAGSLDTAVLDEVAGFVSRRWDQTGTATLIVSSGAVAAGLGRMGLTLRPRRLPDLQALAAVGQSLLMQSWSEAFSKYNRPVAQVLVSADDFRDRRRYLNMRYTIEHLFALGAVPILNENDAITVDELRFGDNDGLAQLIAIKMLAGLLIFLTRVGGLRSGFSSESGAQGEIVEVVERITPEVLGLTTSDKTSVGSGGMGSKLEAARMAAKAGIPTIIAPGKTPGALDRLMRGEGGATLILPESESSRYNRRERFIAFSRVKPRGRIWIDAGAVKALVEGKKSLLPAGVTRAEGPFERGDVVEVLSPEEHIVARGITGYAYEELEIIQGHHSADIEKLLGGYDYDEVIHRDNLVVLE
jgi:glutamate 5-kinase